MNIRIINSVEMWKKELEKINSSNVFYEPWWQKIVNEVFNLKSLNLEINHDGKKYYISLQQDKQVAYSSFIGYGGPLSNYEVTLDIVNRILLLIEEEFSVKIGRVKLYPFSSWVGDINSFNKNTTVALFLNPTLEELERDFDKCIRTSIRYSQKNNVIIKPVDKDRMNELYQVYQQTMVRVGGDYLTPKKLFEYLVENEKALILGAFRNNALIAACVFLECNKGMYYWWNMSNSEGRKYNSNYHLIYEAIKIAKLKNMNFFDMTSSHNNEIEKAKLKWGGIKIPLYIFEK